MNTYLITYTAYTNSDGYETNYMKCNSLEEVQEVIQELQNDMYFEISHIQIYEANEITKFVNSIEKETL